MGAIHPLEHFDFDLSQETRRAIEDMGYDAPTPIQALAIAPLLEGKDVIGQAQTGLLAGGQTLTFMVLALSQVVQAFNMRSERSLFKIGVFSNRKLNAAALSSLLLVCLVLFTPLSAAFGLIALSGKLYLIGLGLILVPVVVMELSKAFGLIGRHH